MPRVLLNQKLINSLTCPQDKTKIDYFDQKLTGLVFKVFSSGNASWSLRYIDSYGKSRETRFANGRITSLNDARQMGRQYLAEIEKGNDPFKKAKERRNIPTFKDFYENFYLPHIKSYKRSWETDVCLINNHLLPVLGNLYLDQISKRDLIALFAKHKENHAPASTNRLMILMRFMLNSAIRWEIPIDKNPMDNLPLYEENNKMERFITKEEAGRLFKELDRSKAKMLKFIIAALLLTGARRGEVLKAKWSDLNLDKRIWTIEFNKTGRTRHVPLSDGILALLEQVPRYEGCEYIFPNPKTLKPYIQIFHPWDRVRKKAGLPELRIHDLRHSFASFLVNGGRSLYEVQKILGHTQIKTTQRYAHLSQDSLRSAADTATNMVPLVQSMPNDEKKLPLVNVKHAGEA